MREFKRLIPIDKAEKYRVEYYSYLGDLKLEYREFKSMKSLDQWAGRNDSDNTIGIMIARRLALLGGEWVPYTTIGRKIITLNELRIIVINLEGEDLKPSLPQN